MDTVLENIASFSTEVRQINDQDTPMAFNLAADVDELDQEENKEPAGSDDEDNSIADEEILGKPSIQFSNTIGNETAPSELNICCICMER